ncbi:hypothetical protein Dimus_035378, partial [Dionaea muscipula]
RGIVFKAANSRAFQSSNMAAAAHGQQQRVHDGCGFMMAAGSRRGVRLHAVIGKTCSGAQP